MHTKHLTILHSIYPTQPQHYSQTLVRGVAPHFIRAFRSMSPSPSPIRRPAQPASPFSPCHSGPTSQAAPDYEHTHFGPSKPYFRSNVTEPRRCKTQYKQRSPTSNAEKGEKAEHSPSTVLTTPTPGPIFILPFLPSNPIAVSLSDHPPHHALPQFQISRPLRPPRRRQRHPALHPPPRWRPPF